MSDWGALELGGRPVGLGVTTPVDVLSYRALWNGYVLETACALYAQAWVLTQMAASPTQAVPTSLDTSSSGVPCAAAWSSSMSGPLVDASTLSLGKAQNPGALLQSLAGAVSSQASLLLSNWNEFSGLSDAQIVLQAASILTTYQRVVMQCGSVIRPTIAISSPGIAAALSQGPDRSAQAQLVAGIEGSGILASGVLQIIGTGAAGVIDSYESLADYAKRVVNAVTSPWFVVPVAAVALAAIGYLVWREVPHRRAQAA